RFVRFSQNMNWINARALCRRNGLDLYEPYNSTAIAIYLDDNFSDSFYWLGARGNGTYQIWLSGGELTRDEPWYSTYYQYVGANSCLAIITHSGYPRRGGVLFGYTNQCTTRKEDVLCG
ncbi:unnamed protein product, partial [Meganyctiphanes norvegica]